MKATQTGASRLARSLTLAALLGASGAVLADAERLEADLRAAFGAGGNLTLGDVSSAMLRSRVTAEDVMFEAQEGERLHIDRYIVSGDYDSPDEVTLEGVRIEDSLTELTLMTAERIVLGEPSRAVFPLHEGLAPEDVRLGSLAIDDIAIELASELAEEMFIDTPLQTRQGRMSIDSVRGKDLTHDAIGVFEMTGVAGSTEDVDGLGSGSFTLESMRFEGLRGIDVEGEERLDTLLLRNLVVDSREFAGSVAQLDLDGAFEDGKGGLRLESLELDLARMIELAPAEERTQLRMASNVLTGGTGELRMDAALLGSWQDTGEHSVLTSDSRIDIQDALRLAFDANLPVLLPEGVTPAEVFADADWLERATLLGGDMHLMLSDQGLFPRLVTLGAATQGVTEAQYIEQARTQAQGFGMMFGPEVQAVLVALVDLLEGSAEELDLRLTLPAQSKLSTYADDPLGLPGKLGVKVETR
ncbi:hypothetical protein [Billgrantia saliphila]|uniref:hypothetical protein n=1 Tax=Billgrantia saliphila TaxID=1848458 RepID=UPI000CE33636|nr:hypothetical protein [Halomonas saliphila]